MMSRPPRALRIMAAVQVVFGLRGLLRIPALFALLGAYGSLLALMGYGLQLFLALAWSVGSIVCGRWLWKGQDRGRIAVGVLQLLAVPSLVIGRAFFNLWGMFPWHVQVLRGSGGASLSLDLLVFEEAWGSVRNVTYQGGVLVGVELISLALAVWLLWPKKQDSR